MWRVLIATMKSLNSDRMKKDVAGKLKDLLKYAKRKKVIIYTENMLKYVASYLTERSIPFSVQGLSGPDENTSCRY